MVLHACMHILLASCTYLLYTAVETDCSCSVCRSYIYCSAASFVHHKVLPRIPGLVNTTAVTIWIYVATGGIATGGADITQAIAGYDSSQVHCS